MFRGITPCVSPTAKVIFLGIYRTESIPVIVNSSNVEGAKL